MVRLLSIFPFVDYSLWCYPRPCSSSGIRARKSTKSLLCHLYFLSVVWSYSQQVSCRGRCRYALANCHPSLDSTTSPRFIYASSFRFSSNHFPNARDIGTAADCGVSPRHTPGLSFRYHGRKNYLKAQVDVWNFEPVVRRHSCFRKAFRGATFGQGLSFVQAIHLLVSVRKPAACYSRSI